MDNKNLEDILSLTSLQEGMLFHYLKEPGSDRYFEQLSLEISGRMETGLTGEAWNVVIRSNEMLRSVFRWDNVPEPVRMVLKEYKLQPKYTDFSNMKARDAHEALESITARDRNEKFNLQEVPFRVMLCRVQVNKYVMIISNHHILYDGWSNGIILSEFFRAYHALCTHDRTFKPPLKTPSKEFIKWSRGHDKTTQKDFWTRFLKGFDSPTELPVKTNKTAEPRGADHYKVILDEGVKEQLELFSGETKITPAVFFYSVWGILLQRYCDSEEVVFGTTVSIRPAGIKGIEEMVGLFINTIPLRVKISAAETLMDVFRRLDETLAVREAHEITPLVDIKEYSEPGNSGELFESIIGVENYPLDRQVAGQENGVPFSVSSYSIIESTNYALGIGISMGREIEIRFNYDPGIVGKQGVIALCDLFAGIVKTGLKEFDRNISMLELLPAENKNEILYDFNNTYSEYPREKTIPELFEEQVERTPDNIAVTGVGEDQVSYRELNKQSHRLARHLNEKGVEPGSIVALMTERSLEMITAIIAVLKSGAAYMPVADEYPQERIDFMLRDSGAKVIVTNGLMVKRLNGSSEPAHKPTNLAYIIYTSGSTGKPKGVMTTHSNVTRVVRNTNYIHLTASDRLLQLSNVAFDGSVFDIYGALLNGGALVLVGRGDVAAADRLAEIIKREAVTVFFVTTALFNTLTDVRIDCFRGVRKILFGGERVSVNHSAKALEELGEGRIVHVYGPTETTVFATYYPIDAIAETADTIPIGRPLANTVVYILDKYLQPVPAGIGGEVYIGGEGVARGYMNRPELTAEKFLDFSHGRTRINTDKTNTDKHIEKLYKTGDLGMWLPGGNIEFIGRIDQQVKIRGFRIEPGEIENTLLRYDAISEAVVDIREDGTGDKTIRAYIVPDESVDMNISQLKEDLSHSLPDYMVPSSIVTLERIPLTSNGKIDRGALPEPESVAGARYVAPVTETQEKVVGIWSGVLGLEKGEIGIDDDFFQLGGHSLKATAMAALVRKTFSVSLQLMEIFDRPTIRQLSSTIEAAAGALEETAIEPVEEKEFYVLSSAQKRIYLQQRMDEQSTAYNMPAVRVLEGEVEPKRLEKAFIELIKRHESLRTSFQLVDEQPVQRIHDHVEFEIELCGRGAPPWSPLNGNHSDINGNHSDINGNHSGINGKHSGSHTGLPLQFLRDFIRPFDLSLAPLLRVGLMGTGDKTHLLMVDMHHIVSDGSSVNVFAAEFLALYGGEEPEEITLRYRDYAQWQQRWLGSGEKKGQEAHWLEQFRGEVPVLELPLDYSRPQVRSMEGLHFSFEIDEEETAALRRLASKTNVTLFMLLFALYNVLLTRLTGQEDIVVGTVAAGRGRSGLDRIIGMFVNTLAIRNFPDMERTFTCFLEDSRERVLAAFDNQDYPFEDLVDRVEVNRDMGRHPLFGTSFVLENLSDEAGAGATVEIPGLHLIPYPHCETGISKFDLSFQANDAGETLCFTVAYGTRIFKESTVIRFTNYFKTIVSSVLSEPAQHIKSIKVMPEEEKENVLYRFNDTSSPFPEDQTLHQLTGLQVEKTPERIAAVGPTLQLTNQNNTLLTYKELNRRSDQVARVLAENGVRPDTIVAIMMERSIEMVIGILGILKAGGAYLPIGVGLPEERIEFMLRDSGAKVLVSRINGLMVRRLDGACEPTNKPTNHQTIKPTNLAYIIYTSGSTGKPKGVLIEHRGAVNVVTWFGRTYGLGPGVNVLQMSDYSFDASVNQVFGSLITGAAFHIVPKHMLPDVEALRGYIENHHIYLIYFVPSLLDRLLSYREKLKSLEIVISGGDRLDPSVKDSIQAVGYRLYHQYGPTEITINSLGVPLSREDIVHLGPPISNVSTYIFDRFCNPVPIGVVGEMYIGGVGVARGYLNRPALTAERFIGVNERLYRTGDLARWLEEGWIEFIGRVDHQVKVKGFRIELGEIEARLLELPAVREAAVIARKDENPEAYLCAYVVFNEEMQDHQIRESLSRYLPDYMIPAYIVSMEALPMTSGSKVDRGKLPAPEIKTDDYTAPRNRREEKLAEIWAESLKIEIDKLGIRDNFFYLGGHSLLANTLVYKIHKVFNVNIPLREVFRNPDILRMAQYIENTMPDIYIPLEPVETREYYPVSSAQERFYVLQQVEADSIGYNIPVVLELEGGCDGPRLEKAFKTMIRRHESLRTSFQVLEGKLVQRVHDARDVPFEILYFYSPQGYRYPHYQGNGGEVREIRSIIESFIRPFDLSSVPLLRVAMVPLEPGRSLLLWDKHHIISDAASSTLMASELSALYRGDSPAPLKLQYRDYSQWQNQRLQSSLLQSQEEWWLKQFEGEVPTLDLPIDFPRPRRITFEGKSLDFTLTPGETAGLKRVADQEGATLFMVLTAVINILLARVSRQQDIVLGIPII
ncbi:MAG: amino acid adenylation domain-containing protein, partial [bacterium]|nr:amino acid adenylation domain-containing protein [bacterium]